MTAVFLGRKQSRGVAIIILLTIIVLGITTALVLQVSTNSRQTFRTLDNAQQLDRARQALIGFALRQFVPGQLPCPDTDGDGMADPAGAGCDDQLGLLPYQTLGIPLLHDAVGAPLWYAVSPELVAGAGTRMNPSLSVSLILDGDPVAAIVIAPGPAINTQTRATLSPAGYLEGINADANPNDFETGTDPTVNDHLLALQLSTLWQLTATLANERAAALVTLYRTSCGEYPWAANFNAAAESIDTQQAGALPLGTALPFDWGAPCGPGLAPPADPWLAAHWQPALYYRMCTAAQGGCLSLTGGALPLASAVLVAPGPLLAGQARPSANLDDYFESENSDGDNSTFRVVPAFEHNDVFNDTLRALP